MKTSLTTALLFPLITAAAVSLTACASNEPVEFTLHNRTQTAVTARVVLEGSAPNAQTLTRKSIAPGDTIDLGPFPPPASGRLHLVLQRDNQFSDVPSRIKLPAGFSAWQIVNPVFRTYSTIALRPMSSVPHNPEWASVPYPPRRGYFPNN